MTVVRRQVAGRSLPYDVGRHGRLVFGILVGALVVASAIYLAFDYRAYWRETEQRLASAAGIVAEYVQQVISIADLTLHSIDEDRLTDDVVISRPSSELHELLKRAQSMSPVLQGLGLTDTHGLVVASAASPVASRADLSDRDYFQVHRAGAGAGLFIGRPVIARPQNVVSLPVSRRAVLPGGAFAGVIAARIDPRIFDTFFEAAGVDAIAVIRTDGVILARYPSIDLVNTPSQSQTEVLIRAQTEPRGIATLRSTVDGIDRLVTFQVIPNPKLVVAVAFASDAITLAWINRIYPFLVFLVGGLAFLAVIARLVQRHARASAAALAETTAARATAEQLADVKGAFLANMSHEIRTPLGGMLGYADLLLKSRLDRRQVEWAVKLKSAGDQLLAVIDDILDYSKLESGNFSIDAKPVPLESVVDEIRSMMVPQAEARGLELRSTFEPTLPRWVRLDPVRLKQILINLLSNAIKFTDRGVVAISVSRNDRAGPHGGLRIDVADTGIGIADDRISSVFERFTQVETHAARGRGGTGLGLSISRRLAELMGGSLALESRLGIGTTVHLALPLEAVAEPPAAPPVAAAGNRTGRILLVDDLPMNLEIAGAMLRSQGHEVTTATSGTDAVDAAVAGDFDAILLDINLPDLDGYEVAREIRKLEPPERRTPIIALTAHALPEHIAQAAEAGMDGHVAKPIDERVLAAQISAVLDPAAEAGAPAEVPLLDRRSTDTLRRLLGPDRLAAMKETFWTSWDKFAGTLERAPVDRARLAYDAHDMVSLAGNVGYRRLAEVCREAEIRAREDEESNPASLIDRMREVAAETRREEGR